MKNIVAQISYNVSPHSDCKYSQLPKPIYYKSLIFALRRTNMYSFPNTSPQARKTIILLLLICGDNSAATNPGPYSLPPQNSCTSCNSTLLRYSTVNNSWHCTHCNAINYTPNSPISPIPLSNSFNSLSPLQSSININLLRTSTPIHPYNTNNFVIPNNESNECLFNSTQHADVVNESILSMASSVSDNFLVESSFSVNSNVYSSPIVNSPIVSTTQSTSNISQPSSHDVSDRSIFTNKSHLRLLNIN